MPVIINGTTGVSLAAANSVPTTAIQDDAVTAAKFNDDASQLFGFRNKIINGDMRIDQRSPGAAITLGSVGLYDVDRWFGTEDSDGTMTMQQSSVAPSGFANSVVLTTGTADASLGAAQYVLVGQAIEGFNVTDFAYGTASAKTTTLSFWVRSSLTGTFGGAFKNSASDRSYPFTYDISLANTWEYKTVTVPGDTSGTWLTDNGVGLFVIFGLGSGSTYSGTAGSWASANYITATGATSVIGTAGATFYLTGVQLEVGSAATPFERRNYQQELAMCQRYFEWSAFNLYGYQTGTGETYGGPINFAVEKRGLPTLGSVTADPTASPLSFNVNAYGVNVPSVRGCAAFVTGSTSAGSIINIRGYRFSVSAEF